MAIEAEPVAVRLAPLALMLLAQPLPAVPLLAQGQAAPVPSPKQKAVKAASVRGGVKGGSTYGATDEFGFKAVDKPVHVHDLHATLLHLLGLDHTRLTFRHAGRDFRLTDVHGRVIDEFLA